MLKTEAEEKSTIFSYNRKKPFVFFCFGIITKEGIFSVAVIITTTIIMLLIKITIITTGITMRGGNLKRGLEGRKKMLQFLLFV